MQCFFKDVKLHTHTFVAMKVYKWVPFTSYFAERIGLNFK